MAVIVSSQCMALNNFNFTDTLDTKEIMPVDDPAIMSSSKTRLTRYNHEELWALKHSKLSAVTPSCLFDPKIVQFKIMDVRTENEHIANQLKLFTERLRQFDISKFDPSLVQLFANYQTSILNRKSNILITFRKILTSKL